MLQIVLFVTVLYFGSSQAAFNCSDPPVFPNYDINSCCRVPHIDLGSAPQKCMREIEAHKKHPDIPAFVHVCYPECIYRESGALVNGEIAMDRVRKFLKDSVKEADKDIVPVITQSFENCINNIKEHMKSANIKMYIQLPDGCSPYASMIWGCVNTDTFINCPDKMWKNDPQCNTARNFIRQCNPLPHVPLPMY